MSDLSDDARGAQFKAVITLAMEEGDIKQFTGIIRGKIMHEPQGDGGFGYDPIFVPEGHQVTFAAMAAAEKMKYLIGYCRPKAGALSFSAVAKPG